MKDPTRSRRMPVWLKSGVKEIVKGKKDYSRTGRLAQIQRSKRNANFDKRKIYK